MCLQQVASNTIKVLNAPDTPHFTFDAVLDMSVQQEGVFAGPHPTHALPLINESYVCITVQLGDVISYNFLDGW